MAHKDLILPRTIALDWKTTTRHKTDVVMTDNGTEYRNANWTSSLAACSFNYNTLRSADAKVVDDYFEICQARAHTLKVWDPRRNTATTAEGKFSGSQAVYRVTRGAYTIDKPVTKFVTGGYALTGGGTIDPLTGLILTGSPTAWSGTFYLCMRFDVDEFEVDGVDYDAKSGAPFMVYKDVPMIEVRGE